jgi:hypothetical protein
MAEERRLPWQSLLLTPSCRSRETALRRRTEIPTEKPVTIRELAKSPALLT